MPRVYLWSGAVPVVIVVVCFVLVPYCRPAAAAAAAAAGSPLPCITLPLLSVFSPSHSLRFHASAFGGLLPAVAAPLPRLLRVLVRFALVARVLQLDGLPDLDRAAGRLDPAGRRAEVGEDEGDVLARVGVRVVLAHLSVRRCEGRPPSSRGLVGTCAA